MTEATNGDPIEVYDMETIKQQAKEAILELIEKAGLKKG